MTTTATALPHRVKVYDPQRGPTGEDSPAIAVTLPDHGVLIDLARPGDPQDQPPGKWSGAAVFIERITAGWRIYVNVAEDEPAARVLIVDDVEAPASVAYDHDRRVAKPERIAL